MSIMVYDQNTMDKRRINLDTIDELMDYILMRSRYQQAVIDLRWNYNEPIMVFLDRYNEVV